MLMLLDFLKRNIPIGLGMTSDILHLAGLSNKTADGKFDGFKPEAIRTHFPRMSKTAEHESRWTALVAKLKDGHRIAVLMHFMRILHEEQQADLVQSAADASQIGTDGEECVLKHLRHIAEIPYYPARPDRQQAERVTYADSLNWIKHNPEDYWIVKIQRFAGRRFKNLAELVEWFRNNATNAFTQAGQHTDFWLENTAEPAVRDMAWDAQALQARVDNSFLGRVADWLRII